MCVRARVCACVRAYVRACVCVRACEGRGSRRDLRVACTSEDMKGEAESAREHWVGVEPRRTLVDEVLPAHERQPLGNQNEPENQGSGRGGLDRISLTQHPLLYPKRRSNEALTNPGGAVGCEG